MGKDVKDLKELSNRAYLAKDFGALKAELIQYATTYFGSQMSDFTPNSLGGLLVEMAAYVGDTMSYYLDHQFNELFLPNAIETKKHRRSNQVVWRKDKRCSTCFCIY